MEEGHHEAGLKEACGTDIKRRNDGKEVQKWTNDKEGNGSNGAGRKRQGDKIQRT